MKILQLVCELRAQKRDPTNSNQQIRIKTERETEKLGVPLDDDDDEAIFSWLLYNIFKISISQN